MTSCRVKSGFMQWLYFSKCLLFLNRLPEMLVFLKLSINLFSCLFHTSCFCLTLYDHCCIYTKTDFPNFFAMPLIVINVTILFFLFRIKLTYKSRFLIIVMIILFIKQYNIVWCAVTNYHNFFVFFQCVVYLSSKLKLKFQQKNTKTVWLFIFKLRLFRQKSGNWLEDKTFVKHL